MKLGAIMLIVFIVATYGGLAMYIEYLVTKLDEAENMYKHEVENRKQDLFKYQRNMDSLEGIIKRYLPQGMGVVWYDADGQPRSVGED